MKKTSVYSLGVVAILLASCGSSIDAIELGDSGAQRTSPVANDAAAGSTEKMWAPYQNMIYTVEGDLPALGGSGQAYEVVPKKLSTDKIMLLAQSFGLNDDVVLAPGSNKENPGYTVGGSTDGSAPGLYVNGDASLSYWSYNNMSAPSRTACAVAPSAPDSSADTAVVAPDCGMPEAPTNLPTKDQAISTTRDLLTNGGLSVENLRFDVYADDWGVSVTAFEQVEGLEVRLQDSMLTSGCAACRGAVDVMETTNNDVASPAVPSDVPDVVVKITGVKKSLLLIWTAKGVPVLLPAYTYSNSDGDVGQVIAVQDKYIKKQEVESPSDPVPAPGTDTVPVEQVPPVSISPTPIAEVSQEQAETLVGLTEDEATKVAQGNGWTIRVAARDGEQFMLTKDYLFSRVNITVVASLVTEVTVG
ncbi:MAG: hypothetical protein NTU52_06445 [Actinobacteria bacterium]|nr:hypothetical protein [Actinomycetota bacterium]